MIWMPDRHLVAALGAREASAFEEFLQIVVAGNRDAANTDTKGSSATK